MLMTDPNLITARTFAGYLQCNTKGQLISRSTTIETPDITELVREQFKRASVAKIQTSTNRRLIQYAERLAKNKQSYLIDCDTTYLDIRQLDKLQQFRAKRKSATEYPFVPILFLPHEPIQAWHKVLLCFSAIAIRNLAGVVPLAGYICYGSEWSITKIRLTDTIDKAVEILQEARTVFSSKVDVPLTLNKHCAVCQFKLRCRHIAIDTDNLSLIGTLGDKERQRLLERGVTTITQLSYGYRPRRKRRIRATAPPIPTVLNAKNDNKLRALALKKKQIHVLNAQRWTQHGPPVYLDVEGVSGEDFFI
jgi:predicted RecB family nuclease